MKKQNFKNCVFLKFSGDHFGAIGAPKFVQNRTSRPLAAKFRNCLCSAHPAEANPASPSARNLGGFVGRWLPQFLLHDFFSLKLGERTLWLRGDVPGGPWQSLGRSRGALGGSRGCPWRILVASWAAPGRTRRATWGGETAFSNLSIVF